MSRYAFEAACVTDAGTARAVNEDACILLRHKGAGGGCALLAVADGVGGLGHGEVASAMAIQALERWWNCANPGAAAGAGALLRGIDLCVQAAHGEILRRSARDSTRVGTTLSVLLLTQGGLCVYHVGDSRVYRVRAGPFGGAALPLTQDHIKLMPKEAGGVTVMKPYLTECLGYKAGFAHMEAEDAIAPGQLYLVCSDGVYKTVADKDIARTVRRHGAAPEKACRALIARAKGNGEKDNLTAAVVRVIGCP